MSENWKGLKNIMSQVFQEGNLIFDFSQARAEKFDNPQTHKAPSFKKIDFIVERNNDILLIEVKSGNPDNIKKGELPFKAKDSLLYLFLMDRYDENKKIKYCVILDFNLDTTMLTRKSDRLKQQLGITNPPWSKRPYFVSAMAFNLKTWNKQYPKFSIKKAA